MMNPADVARRLAELAESGDPEYQNGESENSWLSWNPKVSDVQLDAFEQMLSLGVRWYQDAMNKPETCDHAECAIRAMCESPFSSLIPATTVLSFIHELQMRRSLDAMESEQPSMKDGWRPSNEDARSFLNVERHGDPDDSDS